VGPALEGISYTVPVIPVPVIPVPVIPCPCYSKDSDEVADGVVLAFDENRGLVGIDVQHASKHADISRLILSKMPFRELEAA
jgi:hypothetical protein